MELEELLKQKDITYKKSGRGFLLRCLNPDHEDTNPSMSVDGTTGVFHCFSCGFKGNLYIYFGITGAETSILAAKLKRKISDLANASTELTMPTNSSPYNENYRGISNATLKHFGAFRTTMEELSDRICFPIYYVDRSLAVFIGRHLYSDEAKKYIITPRHRVVPTYPQILEEKTNSIVLVEGIFDMLRLYDLGLRNVVCMFGTSTLFDNTSSKLLAYKVQGVQKVFLCLDGDKAGNDAAKKLAPLVEEAGFIVEVLTLPEGEDPCSMDREDLQEVIDYINENSNN